MDKPVPIPMKKGSDTELRLKKYLRDKVRGLRSSLKEIHENRLIRWRKIYEGVPAQSTREFPFHNASNLVVPIVAIHSDSLLARMMSAVVKTQPPWVAKIVAGFKNAPELQGIGDALEQFLAYVGFEPDELGLYQVYHEWFGETIRYGTSTIKAPWQNDIEDYVVPAGDGSGSYDFATRTTYSGPRPIKLRFNDFLISPTEKNVETAQFKAHRIVLNREALEERRFRKIYETEAVNKVLASPDRTTPDPVQQQIEADSGAKTPPGSYGHAEWDIHECWFKYRIGIGSNAHYVKCIVWYHERTDEILRAFFDYYPQQPFVSARLFYRDDNFFGYGFCEMLEPIAEELSVMHNQRRDSMTVSTMSAWRVDPDSKLHEGYRIFPSAMLPANQGEIEPLQMGQPTQITIDEEKLVLELAEKRTGVSSPAQASGSGSFNKRGIYTAMGTLSLLQEGNTRTDLNITDMRYAHTKVARLVCSEYNHFGIGDRKAMFGEMGEKIENALRAIAAGKIALPIVSSNASINREVEKQSDIMLNGLMGKHYQTIVQMATGSANPMTPPNVKEYLNLAIDAANIIMKTTLRHFGYDEVDRLVPPIKPAQEQPPQGGGQPGGQPQPGMPPGGGQDPMSLLRAAMAQGGGQPQ